MTSKDFSIREQVGALALVVILSGIAGALFGSLSGIKFGKFLCFPGF